MQQDDADARTAKRAGWPLLITRLGEEPPDGVDTSPEERIEMMWELSVRAYGMAGIPIPDYDRANTPIRIVYRGKGDA